MTYKPKKKWKLTDTNTTTIGIAAELLSVDRKQVQRYMKSGRIKWVPVGGDHPLSKRIIYRPDVLKVLKDREKVKKKKEEVS